MLFSFYISLFILVNVFFSSLWSIAAAPFLNFLIVCGGGGGGECINSFGLLWTFSRVFSMFLECKVRKDSGKGKRKENSKPFTTYHRALSNGQFRE